jgi:hypothetical protein
MKRYVWFAIPALLLVAGGVYLGAVSFGRTRECRQDGLCNGLFHQTTDADCRAAPRACLVSGLCHAEDGRCVARSEADCHFSLSCIDRGICALKGGVCVSLPDESDYGSWCGRDTWLDQQGADRCELSDGRCAGSTPHGACAQWKNPEYVHRSACSSFECAASCAETGMCRMYGHCAAGPDGFCLPTEESCASSEACKQRGACSLRKDGRCVPDESGEDCAKSEVCKSYGWCSNTRYENGEDHYMDVCFLGGRRSHVDG